MKFPFSYYILLFDTGLSVAYGLWDPSIDTKVLMLGIAAINSCAIFSTLLDRKRQHEMAYECSALRAICREQEHAEDR